MTPQNTGIYEFGPHRLDVSERVLTRDGRPVALTPKAFDVLAALVERHGRIVTKDELLRRIWPDAFIEEVTLARNIFTVRQALRHDGAPPYIQTVPKRGYRFVAPVSSAAPADQEVPRAAAAAPPLEARRPSWRARRLAVAAALVLGTAYLLWAAAVAPPPLPGEVSVVVLPFVNLTGDPQQEYFGDGLTEEMIAQLSAVDANRLRVIARTSAMQYKGTHKSAAAIGRELGVDYILEGSFRRDGGEVRVTAQLIRTSDQLHVWARTYQRDLGGLLALQRELANTVAKQVASAVTLSTQPGVRQARLVDPAAHDLYLQGLFFWNKRNPDAARKAIGYFEQALSVDPGYALAWVGIANAQFSIPDLDMYRHAERAARRALAIDPELGAAHGVLAFIALHRLDWASADEAFRRARQLDPVQTAGAFGEYLLARGRFVEAIELTRRFLAEDPLSVPTVHGAGINFYYARSYDRAVAQFQKALELDPAYGWSRIRLSQTYADQGRFQEAVEQVEPLGPPGTPALAYAYARMGRTAEARRLLEGLASPRADSVIAYEIALVHTALGEHDQALDWLETAADKQHYHMIYVAVDPKLDPLRGDPRFQALMERIGPPASSVLFPTGIIATQARVTATGSFTR